MSGTDTQQDNKHQTYELPHTIISNAEIDEYTTWLDKSVPMGFRSMGETPNMNLTDWALKERFESSMSTTIPINVGTTFTTKWEINPTKIFQSTNPALGTHVYWRCGAYLKIQLNSNDSYQGLLMVIYESWPFDNYYSEFLNYGEPRLAYNWQVPFCPLLINNKNPIKFPIPMETYPFNYFLALNKWDGEVFNYFKHYPMGRVKVNQVTRLLTKTDITTLPLIATIALTNVIGHGNAVVGIL